MKLLLSIIIILSWINCFSQTDEQLIDIMKFYDANYGTDATSFGYNDEVLRPALERSKNLICESGNEELLREYMVMIGNTTGSADETHYYHLAETYVCQHELFKSVVSVLDRKNEILGSIELGLSEVIHDYPLSKKKEFLRDYHALKDNEDPTIAYLNHLRWFVDYMVDIDKFEVERTYSDSRPCETLVYQKDSTTSLVEVGCGDASIHMVRTRYYLDNELMFIADEHTYYNALPTYTKEKAAAEGVTDGYFLHWLTRVETDKYYFKDERLIAWVDHEGEKMQIDSEGSMVKENEWNLKGNEIKTLYNNR